MTNAVELRSVMYRAGKTFEMCGLDVSVPQGSIYGFLGPNGAGKTTTIRLLMGMLRPGSGSIRVLDAPVPDAMPSILRRTGYVPERPHLYRKLTVAEQIRYHASFYPHWRADRATRLLKRFRLNPDQLIARLSKGETGQLLILLALSQQPDLLVLDEPTDGLDPVVRRDVLVALLDYVSGTDATVLISSHLVHELERICDWVGVLDGGSLVAELPMHSFKSGIKRLRVAGAPATTGDTPFVVLSRKPSETAAGETWIVRGWQDPMRQYFDGVGATLREVIDLDLEEGFVELLRSSRPSELEA